MVKLTLSKDSFKTLWNFILEQLKGRAIKLALKKILGSAAAAGFKGWLVKFVVVELWDEIAVPILNAGLVEVKYIKHKIDGNITAKKIEKARKGGTNEDYDNAVDGAFE